MDFTTYEPRISALEAGGGGGGSTISTANVTINSTFSDQTTFNIVFAYYGEDTGFFGVDTPIYTGQSKTVSAILNNGEQRGAYFNEFKSMNYLLDGNVYYDSDNEYFVITGDCTITISNKTGGE